MIKTCKGCGKQFATKFHQQKYCSSECYHRPKKPRNLKLTEYVCAECGEKFLSLNKKKYCSSECCYKAINRKLNAPVKKNCPVCGKEFEGKYSKKFCSKDCSLKCRKIDQPTPVPDKKIFVRVSNLYEDYSFTTLKQAVNFLSAFTAFDVQQVIDFIYSRKNKIGEYDCFY